MPTYEPEDIVEDLRKRAAALGSRRITAIIVGALLLFFLWRSRLSRINTSSITASIG